MRLYGFGESVFAESRGDYDGGAVARLFDGGTEMRAKEYDLRAEVQPE